MLSSVSIILNELKKGNEIDLMKVNNIWLDNGLAWIINLLQKWAYEILLSNYLKSIITFQMI